MEPKIETNALQDHRINSKLKQIPQDKFKGKELKKDVWDIRTSKRVCGGTYLLVHVFGIIGIKQLCQGEVFASTVVFGNFNRIPPLNYMLKLSCEFRASVMEEVLIVANVVVLRPCCSKITGIKIKLKILVILALILGELALFSVTIGCHRLFAHRTFKNTIWMWCAWHRVHHKCVDTDEDPHNSTRGFFYSHIGWLVLYDRQKLLDSLDKIDMSDLDQEPIVMFQKRSIKPVESRIVSILAVDEGWHNFHHVFPWDYKASELGLYRWNFSTAIIDFFAWVGLAYDLKSVSKETVMKRVARTGDPRHFESGHWGWGDKSIPKENVEQTLTLYPAKET